MNNVKCECGHVNPHGTIQCEACGKALVEETNDTLVDMRYEGSARRSQTYNITIIDKIWNFFSSVKVGVWLIVITLVASGIGTIFPQEMHIPAVPPSEYYQDQYGVLGEIYYRLGFHNLYSSWWYVTLLASIGVSLVICSLDRFIPLYRALKSQRVTRNEGFLKRQRLFSASTVENEEETFEKISANLQKKHYRVRVENGHVLAEKGRFSRWGPYVNHIGLIIFLIGGILRLVPGMYIDRVLWLREGETKVIPETDGQYYLKSNQFILETYEKGKDKEVFDKAIDQKGMMAKNYQSNVTLYQKQGNTVVGEKAELEKMQDYKIRVNHPLKIDGFAIYQVDYKLDQPDKMAFKLTKKATDEVFGEVTIDLNNPQEKFDFDNGYKVEVLSYFPDFQFGEEGQPTTKSSVPNNPAFVFNMISPEKPEGESSFVAIRQTIEPFGDNEYKMAFNGLETKHVSALTVRKDLTLWVLGLGGLVFMIGVVQGAYWNHRRIWLQRVNGEVWIAAHTNKNWFALKRDIQTIINDTEIREPIDRSET